VLEHELDLVSHIEVAEPLHRRVQRRLVLGVRDVAGHGERSAARLLDKASRIVVAVGCDVGDATLAPSRANARAVARPMPLLAPVTNATLPSKRPLMRSP
jgi:hypothetical protein